MTTPDLTPERIAELRRTAEAATPGPLVGAAVKLLRGKP